jgi:excisionase family DNA binding protein
MEKNFYTVEEVADMLSMHPKTIRRYIREGRLAATRIGKSYVIHGHALSLFTESPHHIQMDAAEVAPIATTIGVPKQVRVSSVVDIEVVDQEDSMRITNTLLAAMNSRPSDMEHVRLDSRYDSINRQLRILLWGPPIFVATMLQAVETLTT